jgi:glutathione S-transferase
MRKAQPKYIVYKSDISYFSGKLEAYLRYKAIDYTAVDIDRKVLDHIADHSGVKKMPAIECDDGQWLYDTTPMIQWLESQHRENPITPNDPALAFISLLIEDYADEWLWRPAMWWRWMPRASAWAVGYKIGCEFFGRLLARPVGWYFGKRQQNEWLWNDGMTRQNSADVKDMLFRELDFLEAQLEEQPYLLGSHPSAADFGYFASMFRHFGNDVESSEIMRRQAPNTYEWLARLWNAKPHKLAAEQDWAWPEGSHWNALLERICRDYLPYLHQNSLAHQSGRTRFDYHGKSFVFKGNQTTDYRVWCREQLQQQFQSLPDEAKERVTSLLAPQGGIDSLFADGKIASGLDSLFTMPQASKINSGTKQSLRRRIFGQPRN